jgi:rubrerythrin
MAMDMKARRQELMDELVDRIDGGDFDLACVESCCSICGHEFYAEPDATIGYCPDCDKEVELFNPMIAIGLI